MDGLRERISLQTVLDDRAPIALGPSTEPLSRSTVRLRMLLGVFLLCVCALTVRLGMLSFDASDQVRVARTLASTPARPLVVDRRGRPLIMNQTRQGLAIDGRALWDAEEVVRELTTLFPSIDAGWLAGRLERRLTTQVLDQITPSERQAVMALGLPGISFPEVTARAYPQRDLAAHVLGYTIPGRGGAIGAERALDRKKLVPPGGNAPLRLSIDLVAQQVLEDELVAAMETFSAKAAWGILMDVETGEVRALASLPDFNPNRPAAAERSAWRNRALSDVYELGSAFKPLTAAAALEAGIVTLEETFDVSRPITVAGWTIDDFSRKTEPLTLSEVIQYSSNIGTIMVAQRLGAERFKAALKAFGLAGRVETELVEGAAPMLPRQWGASELASASYGHGIAVSPLQLTAAFTALVNGGIYRTPTFVPDDASTEASRAISNETSRRMRIILRKSVIEGTGGNAEVPGFYPIGKTATADKPGAGGYSDDGPLISSFIGAFPGYDPAYVLLVSLDEPQGTAATNGYRTAGHVAAPIFRRVVERVAPALGMMPVGDDVAFDQFIGLRRDMATTEAYEASVTGAAGALPSEGERAR